jgi:hypothetical protein
MEFIIRFFLGGIIVSAFAIVSDIFRPRTFSGLFGAAPTVALATLGIAFVLSPEKVVIEGRSMMIGGVAFFIYTLITWFILKKHSLSALPAAVIAYLGWFGSAYLLWLLLLK